MHKETLKRVQGLFTGYLYGRNDMDCKDCKHMKRFWRMIGGIEFRCCHEKTDRLPVELFGKHGTGFICRADGAGAPRIKSHPRWCPLREGKTRKGQYVAEWDGVKVKLP